uniref:Transmembrane protein 170B n=2 Tax=Xenopus tropicalis TaxID=8364 RepID=A0A6I8RCY4_XENTR
LWHETKWPGKGQALLVGQKVKKTEGSFVKCKAPADPCPPCPCWALSLSPASPSGCASLLLQDDDGGSGDADDPRKEGTDDDGVGGSRLAAQHRALHTFTGLEPAIAGRGIADRWVSAGLGKAGESPAAADSFLNVSPARLLLLPGPAAPTTHPQAVPFWPPAVGTPSALRRSKRMKAQGGDHSMINLSVQQVLSLWAHGTVLKSLTEMWYWVFLWALFSSLFVHGAAGVLMFVMLQRHKQGRLISVFLGVIGFLASVIGAMITSAAVAGIYRVAGKNMAPLEALVFGIGQTVLTVIISFSRVLATL